MSYPGKPRYLVNIFTVPENNVSTTGAYYFAQAFTTHTGRVRVSYVGDCVRETSAGFWALIAIARDSVALHDEHEIEANAVNENQVFNLEWVDEPGPGTYTYSLYINANTTSVDFGERNGIQLIIEELE